MHKCSIKFPFPPPYPSHYPSVIHVTAGRQSVYPWYNPLNFDRHSLHHPWIFKTLEQWNWPGRRGMDICTWIFWNYMIVHCIKLIVITGVLLQINALILFSLLDKSRFNLPGHSKVCDILQWFDLLCTECIHVYILLFNII